MDFKTYIRRALKSIIYIAVIFMLLFGLIYAISDKGDTNMSFFDTIIPPSNRLQLIAFVVVFGLVYPFISFIKKNVYLNKSFEDERDNVMRVFENSAYVLIKEENNKLYFRPQNKVSRFMRMLEDTIEVDYSDNPIIIKGMRKDAYRIGRHIEYISTQQNNDNE